MSTEYAGELKAGCDLLSANNAQRRYGNEGNRAILEMLSSEPREVLDVGCGSGDNARLAAQLGFNQEYYGITLSQDEQEIALSRMKECWVADIETSDLYFLGQRQFDAILFSHVLEHLKDPASTVSRFISFLRPGGTIVIGVPNVLVFRQRLKFLIGRFDYEDDGVMDATHLRFYTYDSADRYLLASPQLKLLRKEVEGSVPLWFLRHHLLPGRAKDWLDHKGCTLFPNLFGGQILLKARKVT